MKVVVIEMRAAADGEVVSGKIVVERRRTDYWVRENEIMVVSNQEGARRELLLADNQRLVVEGTADVEVVFDRTQSAAVPKQVARTTVASPPDTDGEERDTGAIAEAAISGAGIDRAMAEERQAAAISAARQRLAEARREPLQEPPPKLRVEPLPEPAIDPVPPDEPKPEPTPVLEPASESVSESGPRIKI